MASFSSTINAALFTFGINQWSWPHLQYFSACDPFEYMMADECGVTAKYSLFSALQLYKLLYECISLGFSQRSRPNRNNRSDGIYYNDLVRQL